MKKIIIAGIIVILVLVIVFFAASGHLRVKYPEYYNLDTFKGIEVYVWQNEDGEYRCGAMSGTNRGNTIEELIALADNSSTIKEMKSILSSYKLEKASINIIHVEDPLSSPAEWLIDVNSEAIVDMLW